MPATGTFGHAAMSAFRSKVANSELGLSISEVHGFPDALSVADIASTSTGREDEATLAILYRTSIHRVELGEDSNIGFSHPALVGPKEPVARLGARWCRKRSFVLVVRPARRQQSSGVDGRIGFD